MAEALSYIFSVMGITCLLFMWTSIIRDLAQIRAAQKIECESLARLAKILGEDKKWEI